MLFITRLARFFTRNVFSGVSKSVFSLISFKLIEPPLFGGVASEVSVPFVFGVLKDLGGISRRRAAIGRSLTS